MFESLSDRLQGVFRSLRGEDLVGDRLGDGEFVEGGMGRLQSVECGLRKFLGIFELIQPSVDRVEAGLN